MDITESGVQTKEKLRAPRKIFDVIIRKTTYGVYDIDGREHAGYGDVPKTWWLYYNQEMPEGGPDRDSAKFVPFHKWIKRRLWDIRIKDWNSSKVKWDDYHFSHGTKCEMWCNGRQVYEFTCGDTEYAFAKAQVLMTTMSEHPFDFFEPERMNGRLIYFYGLPAILRVGKSEPWNVSIVPDYGEMEKEKWWLEYDKRSNPETFFEGDDESGFPPDDSKDYGYINWGDALSDDHIKWFREKKPISRSVITEKYEGTVKNDLIE